MMAKKPKSVTDDQRAKALLSTCLKMAADPDIPLTRTKLVKILIKELQKANRAAGVGGKGACRIYHTGDTPTCYDDMTREQCENPEVGGVWEEGGRCSR